MDREAWRAAVHGIAKSQIWLKDWTEEIIAKNLQSLAKDINLYCCSVGKLCSTLRDPENYSTPSSSVLHYLSVQVSSVTQSCLTLCSPMDCSMPGLPIHHQLPELVQTHVQRWHRWCHPTILPSVFPFSWIQYFPATGSFPMSQSFTSGGQSTGASASASVLPLHTQDWFPLGLTGLISLQSKVLSGVFFNTTVQKHQFFSTWLSLWSNSHNHTRLLEKP